MVQGIITPGIIVAAILIFSAWIATKAKLDDLAFIFITISIIFIGY